MLNTLGIVGLIFTFIATLLLINQLFRFGSRIKKVDSAIRKHIYEMISRTADQILNEKFKGQTITPRLKLNMQLIKGLIKDVTNGKGLQEIMSGRYAKYNQDFEKIDNHRPPVEGRELNRIAFEKIVTKNVMLHFPPLTLLTTYKRTLTFLKRHQLALAICLLMVGFFLQLIEKLVPFLLQGSITYPTY